MATSYRRQTRSSAARRGASVVAACAVVAAGFWTTTDIVGADSTSDTAVFTNDGTYTVPDGVTSLHFAVTGAGGGSSTSGPLPAIQDATATPFNAASAMGGNGGVETGLLTVTPGEVLTIKVGRAGGGGASSADQADAGGIGGSGFGNGGKGGSAPKGYPSAGGGGGGSAILSGTTPQVVAGGGGGASGSSGVLALGSPLNYFGGCPSHAIDAPSPDSTTTTAAPSWNAVPCDSSVTSPPSSSTLSWLDACPGLSPGTTPSGLCPIGATPVASRDGAAGIEAKSDEQQANGPGGGGGGGATGGAGGIAAANSLTTGGGQGGANFADPNRTSEVAESTADNAGGIGNPTTFCLVADHILSAGDPDPGPPICGTVGSPASDGEVTLTPVTPTNWPEVSTSPTSVDPTSTSTIPAVTQATETDESPSSSTTDASPTSTKAVPPTSVPAPTPTPAPIPPPSTTVIRNSITPTTTAMKPVTHAATTAASTATPVAATPTYTG